MDIVHLVHFHTGQPRLSVHCLGFIDSHYIYLPQLWCTSTSVLSMGVGGDVIGQRFACECLFCVSPCSLLCFDCWSDGRHHWHFWGVHRCNSVGVPCSVGTVNAKGPEFQY
jgi:hypothetical protein